MIATVCVVGELLAEFLSHNPRRKFTRLGEFIGSSPSGAPTTFAAQVAKLPHQAVLFGCVGNDDFTRLIIERLRHEGVITNGIHVTNNAVIGMAFVSYQNPQQRDFVLNIPSSACGLFTIEHTDKDLPKQRSHLYIVGSSLFSFRMIDVVCKAVTAIKSAGGTVSFDSNIRKEMLSIPEMAQALDYLIGHMDTFIPSESELPFFARHKNLSEEQIVSDLLHDGVKHVAIKRAQRGASYYKLKNGTLHTQHVVGHDIKIIDPTGADDCFGATFITLFLFGLPAHKTLRYANASGALAVMRRGPMEGISSLANIEDLLQQH